MKTGDMQVSAERPAQHAQLVWTVAMAALMAVAAVTLWYFNPSTVVAAQIHEIAIRGKF